eukprot:TRINITY_DN16679_c0_g1_i1.p1 TRINITY_DN16679_c0_g1~~TRINITY_DN16679_c0_g1_i1.p1  ORF type:complete len:258 (-),score=17.37 TRINITY_DN16679_c0_g1_i1:200-865(-)
MEAQWREKWGEVQKAAEEGRKAQQQTISSLMEGEGERVVAARAVMDRYGSGVVQRNHLRFSHHPDINDHDAGLLLQALRRFRPSLLPTITAVSFSWGAPPGCKAVTGEALEHATCLSGLRSLDLRFCAGITADGLYYVGKLSMLDKLELCEVRGVTDSSLAYLADLPALRYLDISGCSNVTDLGMDHIAQMPSLRQLRITGCHQISVSGLRALPPCVQVTR